MGNSGIPKVVELTTPVSESKGDHNSVSPLLSVSAATAEDIVLNVSLGFHHSAAVSSKVNRYVWTYKFI